MAGRSIKIFLVDGTSSGVRTAELGLSTIKALVVPRASLSAVTDRVETQKTGVYILIGPDEETPNQKSIYIGEGDLILRRLLSHNKDDQKDFWEEAIFFVSKDENLTKAHVRYLEAKLISLALAAKRAKVTNSTAPSEVGKLPEADTVEMDEFISQARLLLGALSYDIFEPSYANTQVKEKKTKGKKGGLPTFKYASDYYDAECFVDVETGQFLVTKGSLARKQGAQSLGASYKSLRATLVENGILIDHNENSWKFSQDYAFSSATAAAQVVSGSPISGRAAWKNTTSNQTYADWEDSLIPKPTENNSLEEFFEN